MCLPPPKPPAPHREETGGAGEHIYFLRMAEIFQKRKWVEKCR